MDDLLAVLERGDIASRPGRAARLRLLLDEYGGGDIRVFPGGPVSALAFEEARDAYLHGLFVACTLMCQVCVEHMLAGLFRVSGRDDLERAGFEALLGECVRERLLSVDEFDVFDRIRTRRNPYVHARAPGAAGTLPRRAIDADSSMETLVEQDARDSIIALLRLCRRPPFTLGE